MPNCEVLIHIAERLGGQLTEGPALDEIISTLEALIQLLEAVQDRSWPPILRTFHARARHLNQEDREASRKLLSDMRRLFGGMGSLADLVISPQNGHSVLGFPDANQRLNDWVDRLYLATVKVQKHHMRWETESGAGAS